MQVPYEIDLERQLDDMKRLVAYLMARNGQERIRVPMTVLDQIPDAAEIAVWQNPASFELIVATRGVPPVDGIVDAEIVTEPPTFHYEPNPELPGVVRPVLDQAVRVDPATGAVEWGD